jgi:hypothetical protein
MMIMVCNIRERNRGAKISKTHLNASSIGYLTGSYRLQGGNLQANGITYS